MRAIIKRIAQDLSTLIILPLFIWHQIESLIIGKQRSFQGASQFVSLIPGIFGDFLRNSFYRLALDSCSRDAIISFGTVFSSCACKIGHHVSMGIDCLISQCEIQDNVIMGSNIMILSGNKQHSFADIDIPIRLQGREFKSIAIGEDCWVGNGAIIMANIGKKCVVGAGSVVTKDTEDFSVLAGNPARVIKKRI